MTSLKGTIDYAHLQTQMAATLRNGIKTLSVWTVDKRAERVSIECSTPRPNYQITVKGRHIVAKKIGITA